MSDFTGVFRARLTGDAQHRVCKRQPVSCSACRARKLKCDRQKPVCGSCLKRDDAAACRYQRQAQAQSLHFHPRGGNGSAGEKTSDDGVGVVGSGHVERRPGKSEVASRLRRLEEMVNAFVRSNRNAEHSKAPQKQDSQRAAQAVSESAPVSATAAAAAAAAAAAQDIATAGTMSNQTPKGSFVGPTNWIAVLESIHDIQGYLESDGDVTVANNQASSSSTRETPGTDPGSVFDHVEPVTTKDILAALPPRTECDRLLHVYFQARLTKPPLLHLGQFQRLYAEFWTRPDSASLLWVSTLFSYLWVMVQQLSSRNISLPSSSRGDELLSLPNLRSMATRCLVAGSYLKCRPWAPEALVLLYATYMLQPRGDGDPMAWHLTALAVRLAQRMGYHRDPSRLGGSAPRITPFEGEMRRRTWYMVEAFDMLYSFQQGIPPVVHEADCDVRHPTNLRDEDFDEDSPSLPPERPFTDVTPVLYYCFKSRLLRLLRRVIRHALSTRLPDYAETCALDAELTAVHEQVPPALRHRPMISASFADSVDDVLHRGETELVFIKCLCVLHRSYLTYEKVKGELGTGFRVPEDTIYLSIHPSTGVYIKEREKAREREKTGRLTPETHLVEQSPVRAVPRYRPRRSHAEPCAALGLCPGAATRRQA